MIVELSTTACSSSTLASAVLTAERASSTCGLGRSEGRARAFQFLLALIVEFVGGPAFFHQGRRASHFIVREFLLRLVVCNLRLTGDERPAGEFGRRLRLVQLRAGFRVSIRATTSPGDTRSPSCGTISITRPEFLSMSTCVASTRPLTLTMPAGNCEASTVPGVITPGAPADEDDRRRDDNKERRCTFHSSPRFQSRSNRA